MSEYIALRKYDEFTKSMLQTWYNNQILKTQTLYFLSIFSQAWVSETKSPEK